MILSNCWKQEYVKSWIVFLVTKSTYKFMKLMLTRLRQKFFFTNRKTRSLKSKRKRFVLTIVINKFSKIIIKT